MKRTGESTRRRKRPFALRLLLWTAVLALSGGVVVGCSSSSTAPTSDNPPEEASIVLSESAVDFQAEEGGENPPGQEIGVTNGGDEALTDLTSDLEYAAGQPTGWLTASPTATTAPATLTLDAAVGSLAAGSYEATVFVRASTASNTPQTVDVTFDVQSPPGDPASPRDVVISEINWFGNGSDSGDEWIELRNVSGTTLDLSGWTLEGAGTGADPVILEDGIQLANGEYLLLAELQGADTDGERTSLTGVGGVHLHSVELANSGEILSLRDVEGSLIDRTPTGSWPAGDETLLMSMERRDDITGGGYTAGDQATSWYTWNADDGRDTTHPATADQGTPGADNTDPSAAAPSPEEP